MSIRVMVERGKKKRVVACAFDWPGWDRSARNEVDALAVLDAYRPRLAPVVALAGLADEFARAGPLEVVERLEGIGMTDYYGVSGRPAGPEHDRMSEAACERKIAILRARGPPSTRSPHGYRRSSGRVRAAAAASAITSSAT